MLFVFSASPTSRKPISTCVCGRCLAAELGDAEPGEAVALEIASDHDAGYADVRDTRIWDLCPLGIGFFSY